MSHLNRREPSPEDLARFGAEIDDLRARTVADLGERDARYIRRIYAAVRWIELLGRGVLMACLFMPQGWIVPTVLAGGLILGIAKILDNMELGHNVIHGQGQYEFANGRCASRAACLPACAAPLSRAPAARRVCQRQCSS